MDNVLVIMSDEHQARALGCANHPVVQTPHLDALAATGTRFTNCWTPSPICVPARASLATGRWVHDVGAWDSAQAYDGQPAGWAHVMRSEGWHTRSFGKLHHRSAADDDGFSERVLPMFIAGGVGWLQGLPRRDPLPFDEAVELAADVGIGETTYTRYDQRVTDAAVEWITQDSADSDKPWAAFVSLVAPHYPLSAGSEWHDLYPLDDVPPPEIARIETSHPAVRAMRTFFDYGAHFDDDLARRGRQAYFALTSWMDHNVGRLLGALGASGQRDRTRVIYTSDHGEMAGNRGLWCKSFMYRDSVDVPLIVSGPGMAAGAVNTTNVNLVDVAATVADAANAEVGVGESLWTLANAGDQPDRLGFSEYHDGGSITASFALRHDRWKYIEHVGYPCELYDIADDPDELVDLGAVAGLSAVRRECGEALRSIVDPEGADAAAFASQERLLEEHGGRARIAEAFRFNHTPAPS